MGPYYVKVGDVYTVPSESVLVIYPNDEAVKNTPKTRSFFNILVYIKNEIII